MTGNSLGWLPGFLITAGLFFVAAGLFSDGPDRVGGIVFGVVSLAAGAAILHRRARDADGEKSKVPPPNEVLPQAGSGAGFHARQPLEPSHVHRLELLVE